MTENIKGLYSWWNRPRTSLSILYRPWFVRNIAENELLSRSVIIARKWFSKKVTVYEIEKVSMTGKRINGSGSVSWIETYYTGREWVFLSMKYAKGFVKDYNSK